MHDKVSTNLDFVNKEKQIIDFWKKNNIFEKSINARNDSPVFTFYDGPPTANGLPHIGHVLTRAIKDIIPRYKTMKGYKVLRKAGWDTHGLPVELEIEKKLNISGKPQIESFGIEPFVKECKESVFKYESLWVDMSNRVGFFADMLNPYVTYYNEYIESVWWALKQIWEKGLIYKGHKVVPYCPRCGTSLSSHEVAQGYKDVKDKTAFAKFLIKDTTDEYFLAWTTTPWTLPSNVALAVNPDELYAKIQIDNEKYILAKALIEKLFEKDQYKLLDTFKGKSLEGISYIPLFDYAKNMIDKKAHYVVCDGYVTLTDGTGIVHLAPAFGEDDYRVCKNYDLPVINLVNEEGKFVNEVTDFAGIFVKDADIDIIKKLKTENKLLKAENYEHSYPFCWRCDTPLLYYARNTWFIAMTKVKDNLIKNNDTVTWYPDNIKKGRFGNFLENVVDWGLSRERYWGTPLPIWECACGHKELIGSIKELKEKAKNCPDDIELHKPYIDNVHLNCPKCQSDMKRVTEVIDCWFDSGCMPFAQWHYPFENEEIFNQNFPADFISEAIDQTRGWFYTLMAISTLIFDKAPYKNVIVLGHVQDKNGKKMSKSKGNAIEPTYILEKQGTDAVRWYFYSNSAPWLPNRFYEEAVNEGQRKFMGTLWNTYAFYVLYANIDNFNAKNYTLDYKNLAPMDKWILSKLNSLIKFVDNGLNNYKLTETARALLEFIDELSNWYVRRSRERFWAKAMDNDKISAYMTLYTALTNVIKLAAPFVPFITEAIYQNLVVKIDENAKESIHLCDFPTYDESLIDKDLEHDMDIVLSIVVAGRAARNNVNVKNRQPLQNMYIKSNKILDNMFIDIIKDELNIKDINFKDDLSSFTSYSFKPLLKVVGKKYGKFVPQITQFLKETPSASLMEDLKNKGFIQLNIEGEEIKLTEDELLIEMSKLEGFVSETEKDITIVIDTTLTESLIEEGFIREIISKIQTMRKEAEFNVLDRIEICYTGNEKISNIITKNSIQIKEEVLANDISKAEDKIEPSFFTKSFDINGEDLTLYIKKS